MAWNMIWKPGTECGPCEHECQHTDCARLRTLARSVCGICGRPIGYDTKYVGGGDTTVEHFMCYMKRADEAWTRATTKRKTITVVQVLPDGTEVVLHPVPPPKKEG